MSEQIGKLLSCDRCGETIFLKWEGMSEFDGGYSKIQHFEKVPEGWTKNRDVGDLCPDCSELYQTMMHAFKEMTTEFVSNNMQRYIDIFEEELCQNQNEDCSA